MHLPQEMIATMRYLDLTANPKKPQLLGLQGRVKDGYKGGQARERTGRAIGCCRTQKSKASCNG